MASPSEITFAHLLLDERKTIEGIVVDALFRSPTVRSEMFDMVGTALTGLRVEVEALRERVRMLEAKE